ncbi:hypothetical protein ACFWNT_38515 [Streptomyces sp. NPDC058409]|uniref:hypothetical protein n=1 Tax=Streptomyces sp. NPDC058409 TaxID=3346484 RepID=UPI00366170AF
MVRHDESEVFLEPCTSSLERVSLVLPCRAKLCAMAPSIVRGLALPAPLTSLIDRDLWHQPGDAVLAKVIPWFEHPLVFVSNSEQMAFASQSMDIFADDPHSAYFRQARGSRGIAPLELPWLDVEQAVLIAITRNPGDEGALAFGYRTDPSDPRIVGSDYWTDPFCASGGSSHLHSRASAQGWACSFRSHVTGAPR